MAYRLRPRKSFTAEFRAVAENQLEKAIRHLGDQPDGPHEAVHDARKRFKRVRALYRLIQQDAPDFRSRENARIRDVAHSLSAVRDATALVETLDYLMGFAASDEERETLSDARETLSARRDRIASQEHDLSAKMATAVDACRDAIMALDDLKLSDTPAKTARHLGKAWRRQLKKAHVARDACEQCGGAENYHDLRKSAQAYWMHLSLLRDIWPSAMRTKQLECKALVDLLGHEHDLSVLTALADAEPNLFGTGETLARLLAAIIARQQILREEALDMADSVFAETPEMEAGLIALLWKRAAGAPKPKKPRKALYVEEEETLHGQQ